jgi:hypothetical protein
VAAGTVVGGAMAAGLLTVATVGYFVYQGSWTRQSATNEIAKRMRQEMRNRVMTYVGIAKRSFRKLGFNAKYFIISQEFKAKIQNVIE